MTENGSSSLMLDSPSHLLTSNRVSHFQVPRHPFGPTLRNPYAEPSLLPGVESYDPRNRISTSTFGTLTPWGYKTPVPSLSFYLPTSDSKPFIRVEPILLLSFTLHFSFGAIVLHSLLSFLTQTSSRSIPSEYRLQVLLHRLFFGNLHYSSRTYWVPLRPSIPSLLVNVVPVLPTLLRPREPQ